MYYVVRLAGINQREKHHVFPISWMRDSEVQLEKFVKNRINRNQVHLFFWSIEQNNSGEPDASIQPDFNLPIQNVFPPTNAGCYLGQPISFFCNYVEARAYVNGLRTVRPGLYNARRLGETPLPDLNQSNATNNSDSEHEDEEEEDSTDGSNNSQSISLGIVVRPESSNTSSNNNEEQENGLNDSTASFDELAVTSSSDGISDLLNDTNDGKSSENQNREISSSSNSAPANNNVCANEKKPELRSLDRVDLAEIDAILNDNDEAPGAVQGDVSHSNDNEDQVNDNGNGNDNVEANDEEDDVIEWTLVDGHFPGPVQYSCDHLLKRENDSITGRWAYNIVQVCTYKSTL